VIKNISLFLSGFLLISVVSLAQQSDREMVFHSGPWQDVLRDAKSSGKYIFVDFYTDWCKPCKWMEKSVFTDTKVAAYFNEHVISYRINAEKNELELVEEMNLAGYPTLMIFNSDGNKVLENVGALDGVALIGFAKKATMFSGLQKAYYDDPDNIEKLAEYLGFYKSVSPDDAAKLAIEGMKSMNEENLRSHAGWFLISNFPFAYESREILYVIDHAEYYYETFPDFGDFMGLLYEVMITDAASDMNKQLAVRAAEYEIKVRTVLDMLDMPAIYYTKEAESQYFLEMGDLDRYFDLLDAMTMTYHFDDWQYLSGQAVEHAEAFFDDKEKMTVIFGWTHRALELENNYYTNFAHSYTFFKIGNNAEALIFAKKAFELCTEANIKPELQIYILDIQEHMN